MGRLVRFICICNADLTGNRIIASDVRHTSPGITSSTRADQLTIVILNQLTSSIPEINWPAASGPRLVCSMHGKSSWRVHGYCRRFLVTPFWQLCHAQIMHTVATYSCANRCYIMLGFMGEDATSDKTLIYWKPNVATRASQMKKNASTWPIDEPCTCCLHACTGACRQVRCFLIGIMRLLRLERRVSKL